MPLEESQNLHPGADTCFQRESVPSTSPSWKLAENAAVCSMSALISHWEIKEHLINKYLATSFPFHFQVSIFPCTLSFLLWSLTNYAGHQVLSQGRQWQAAVSLGELSKKYASRASNCRNSVLSAGACEEIPSTNISIESRASLFLHFNFIAVCVYLCVCILLFFQQSIGFSSPLLAWWGWGKGRGWLHDPSFTLSFGLVIKMCHSILCLACSFSRVFLSYNYKPVNLIIVVIIITWEAEV